MTEYAIYLDDSGHPSDQPRVVTAGFLSSETQWLRFEPKWLAALEKYGLGRVFHMTDFESSKRSDRGRVLERLTSIIRENTQTSFSCYVSMDAYRRINGIYALEEALGTPYALAVRGLVKNVNSWKEKYLQPEDHISIYVEEGTRHIGDMEEVFRRDGLPIPQKVPKQHPRVQPSDLLAWELFHYDDLRPARRSMVNLLKIPNMLWSNHGKFVEDNILEACRKIKELRLRKDLPPDAKHVYHTTPKRFRRRTIK